MRKLTDQKKKEEVNDEIRVASRALIEEMPKLMSMSYRIALVAGLEVQTMMDQLYRLVLNGQPAMLNQPLELAIIQGTRIENLTRYVLAAIRKELGFPDIVPTAQSTESSAVASPAAPEAG